MPRLADFALFGVSVASVLCEDNPSLFDNIDTEPFMTRYQKQLDDVDEQSIEGSPSIDALVNHLESRGGLIETTVGQLFDDLRDLYSYRQHNWPKSPRGFRNCVDRAMPALRSKGIEVIFHQSRRNGRGITLSSLLYRQEQANGKTSSPTSPSPLLRVIEKEIRSAHQDRELRALGDHDSRAEFNFDDERGEYEIWQEVEEMTPDSYSQWSYQENRLE